MHVLDILLAVIALVFVFTGIRRGLIGEIIRFTAMIAGCVIAFLHYHRIAAVAPVKQLPLPPHIKNGVAFILVYIACVLAIVAAGWLIKKAVHLTPLGLVDRVAGGAIGLLKAFLIAYVACLSIASLPVKRIHADFRASYAYKTYSALPDFLSLKNLLKQKAKINTIFEKKPSPEKIHGVKKKFDDFKAVVDSAKKAQTTQ